MGEYDGEKSLPNPICLRWFGEGMKLRAAT